MATDDIRRFPPQHTLIKHCDGRYLLIKGQHSQDTQLSMLKRRNDACLTEGHDTQQHYHEDNFSLPVFIPLFLLLDPPTCYSVQQVHGLTYSG